MEAVSKKPQKLPKKNDEDTKKTTQSQGVKNQKPTEPAKPSEQQAASQPA